MDSHDIALTIHELIEGRDLKSPVVFEPLSNAFMLVAKQLAESEDFRYGSSVHHAVLTRLIHLQERHLGKNPQYGRI